MGYTTLATPGDRVKYLNKQHKIASDVGAFRHVFAVPTAASYLSEQALFDFLPRFRVAEKREFFYGPLHHFMEAMKAAGKLSYGDASALNALYEKDDEANVEMPFPAFLRTPFVPDRPDGGGWVYACRNIWHQEDIYKIGVSAFHPYKNRDSLNADQKKLTCQIGFYEVAYCAPVVSVPSAKRRLLLKLKPHQIDANAGFYKLDPVLLKSLIDALTPQLEKSKSPICNKKYKMPTARRGWMDCPDCLSTFKTDPSDGAVCPECGWSNSPPD